MSAAGWHFVAWLTLVSLAAGPAHAITPLEALLGDWSGHGESRERLDKPMERVACRMTARSLSDSTQVEVRGRCSGRRGSARFAIAIASGASGDLTGVLTASLFKEALNFQGRQTARSVVFETAAPILFDGRSNHSRVDITFSNAAQFTMHQIMTDLSSGRTQTILDMSYVRKRGN